MADILLSAATRSSLFALSSVQSQMTTLQTRLATGKRVNQPTDNPINFFLAAELNGRAGQIDALTSGITDAQGSITAANNGIASIRSLLTTAQSVANQALQSSDPTVRAGFATQFDGLLQQVDAIAADSGFNGVNLLTGSSTTVNLNETGTSNITITGSSATSSGLGVAASTNQFQLNSDINTAMSNVSNALNSLQGISASLGATSSVMQSRLDFNKSMINTLQSGADSLTLSDTNEDSASLLALQTRQQIAAMTLSLARDRDTSVLRLFDTSR